MHKSARIQPALLSHRLMAGLLDILTLFVFSLGLYFILLYTVFSIFGYLKMSDRIAEIEEEYNLKLPEGEDYKTYEEAIKDIYFNHYSNEIVKQYKDNYGKDYSITHIYNIVILRLPAEPTFDNYKTDFYQYTQKSDGTFDVDSLAVKVEGSGINYDRSIQSLFHSGYKRMSRLVENYNEEYFNLNAATYSHECYARLISFIISFILLFIVIPFKNEVYQTFWMKKYDLAYVSYKTGYNLKRSKVLFRYILSFILPLVGFVIATKYSIVILILGYFMIDNLLMLFSNENLNIADRFLKIETCKHSDSLLFDDKKDEEAFLASEEGKKVTDIAYVKKLEEAEEIIVTNISE